MQGSHLPGVLVKEQARGTGTLWIGYSDKE